MNKPKESVLIVEDSRAIRESLAACLKDAGYRTLEAEDGESGIAVFRSNNPDIVITDIIMPGTDGHEVVKTVVRESPDTPVIVVSGSGNISDVVKAIKLGTWDYILKPISDLQVLLYSIKKAMDTRNLILENRSYQQNLEKEISIRTAELNASLREKEQLLKEVHHRVKNNLQIIVSLLNLQIGIEKNSICTVPMEKMKNRINSMALVHEQLYLSADMSHIPFDAYVDALVIILKESIQPSGRVIELNTDIPSIFFPIEKAVPLGLIINELTSNSLQHAFPDTGAGRISISMSGKAGQFTLTVSDDGIGVPESTFPEGTGETLGFVLVSTLAKQLGGKLKTGPAHESGSGTGKGFTISLTFPSGN